MATIRPNALPLVTTVTAGDVVILDGATVRSITAANFITSAVNLTGPITSVGNATSIASQTGTGSKFVVDTAPTLVTPVLGVATATNINKIALTAPATGSTLTIPDGVVLTGPAASGTVMTLGNVETITGAKTFNDGKLILAGATSGTTVLKSGGTAGSSVLTLPVATDTLMGKATTDILTNKTFDSAGTGNVLKVSGVTVSAGQYPGEPSTGSATTGNIGELLSVNVAIGSAVGVTSGSPINVTQLSLTAGDWEVSAVAYFTGGTTTSVVYQAASLGTTTGALNLVSPAYNIAAVYGQTAYSTSTGNGSGIGLAIIPNRFSLATTTTVFLVVQSTFTVSTTTAFGGIHARRIR